MADIELTMGFAFNKQDLDKAYNQVDKIFSDLEVNPNLEEGLKKQIVKSRTLMANFSRDLFRDLEHMDLSHMGVDEFVKYVTNRLQDVVKPINQMAIEIQKVDASFDAKSLIDGIDGFANQTLNAFGAMSQLVNKAGELGVRLKFDTDIFQHYDSLVDTLNELSSSINKVDLDKLTKEFMSNIKTVEQADDEYQKSIKDFEEYAKQINTVSKLKKQATNPHDQVQWEVYLRDLQAERLKIALRMEALYEKSSQSEKPFFQQNTKLSKIAGSILDDVEDATAQINKDITLTKNNIGEIKAALNSGYEFVLPSEIGADNIINKGAIPIKVKLSLDVTTQELYEEIINKTNEVQALISQEPLIVPIKYNLSTDSDEALSPTQAKKKTKKIQDDAKNTAEQVLVDFTKVYSEIEDGAVQAATEAAKKSIEAIKQELTGGENSEGIKIPVTLDLAPDEIDKINQRLKDEELGSKLDLTEPLVEAKEKADALLEAFKAINDELINNAKSNKLDITDYTGKSAETLEQEVNKALERAKEARLKLEKYFTENPVHIEFDYDDAVDKLTNSLKAKNLSGEINITENIEKAITLTDELGKHIKAVKDSGLDEALGFYDLTELLSHIQLISANISGIVEQLKKIQSIQIEAPVQEMRFGLADEVLPLVENLIDSMDKLQSSLSNSFQQTSFKNLESILQSIANETYAIQQNINSIKINDKVIKSFENLRDSLNTLKGVGNSVTLNNFADALERIDDVDADKITAVLGSFKTIRKPNVENIKNIAPALKQMKKDLEELDKTSFTGFLVQIESILHNANALKDLATIVSSTKGKFDSISNSFNNLDSSITKPVEKIENSLKQLGRPKNVGNFIPDYEDKINQLESFIDEFNKIKNMDSHLRFQSDIDRAEDLKNKIVEINYQLQETDKLVQAPAKTNNIKKITKFLKESSKLTEEERKQLEALIQRLNNPNLSMTEMKEIMATFNQISTNAIKAGRATSSFFDAIKNKLKYGWAQTFATFFSFYDIIRYIREVSSTVTELNSSLIELAKVSDASIGELYGDFQDFASIAQKTGGTINDIIKATADWARNGYNIPQSKELARVSSIFQNIGDGISQEQANEYLVSTLKGFRLEAEDSIHIADVINNVSNNAASGVSDIGEALERSSSALGAANTSLEKSVALLTTANEVLQNPETVGTAFKSMAARLRAADTEIQNLEDGFTMTTSKLRNLIKALTGFDIQATEDSYKDIYDILLGISKEWNTLTDIQQASLSEELFGKRNSQVGFAILQNGERLEKIYELAQNSAGSAMEEQEKYMESVTYQIDRFKASLEELANDIMSADVLKYIISFGTDLINLLDAIIDKAGSIPLLLSGIGAAFSFKGWGFSEDTLRRILGKETTSLNDVLMPIKQDDLNKLSMFDAELKAGVDFSTAYSHAINDVSESLSSFAKSCEKLDVTNRNLVNDFLEMNKVNQEYNITQLASSKNLKDISNVFKIYHSELSKTNISQQEYVNLVSKTNPLLGKCLTQTNSLSAGMRMYTIETIRAKVATAAFKVATMALQFVFVALASWIAGKIIQAIDELIITSEEAIKIGEEARSKIEEITKALQTQQKTVKESARRFAELSQGVDQVTGKNISLSNEDYEEFLNISNELAELFPTLSYHYDENGNKIVNLTGNVDTIVSSLENLLKVERQLAQQKILENMDDVYKGAVTSSEKYEKKLIGLNTSAQNLNMQMKNLQNQLEKTGTIVVADDKIEIFEKNLKSLGIAFQGFRENTNNIYKVSISGYESLSNETKEQILSAYANDLEDLRGDFEQIYKQKISSMSSTLSEGIAAYLFSDYDYANLSEPLQANVQSLINNLDISALDFKNWDELKDFLDRLVDGIGNQKLNFSALMDVSTQYNAGEITWGDFKEKIEALMDVFDALGLDDDETKEIKRAFTVLFNIETDENGNVINRAVDDVKQKIEKATGDIDLSDKIVDNLVDSEIKALQNIDINWAKVLNQPSFDAQMNYIRSEIRKASTTPFTIAVNKQEISNAAKGVKELQSVFQSLYEKNKDKKKGSDLAFLTSELDELKSKLVDAEGNIVNLGSTWDNFFDIMTDGSHTYQEMKESLDDVVTAYVNATVSLQNFDRKQADFLSTQLQAMGVTKKSADEYVQAMLDRAEAVQYATDKGYDFEGQLDSEAFALLNEAEKAGYSTVELARYILQKQLANGLTIDTSGSVSNLLKLAKAAQVSADALSRLTTFQNDLRKWEAKYDVAEKAKDETAKTIARDQIKGIQKSIETFVKEEITLDDIDLTPNISLDSNKVKSKSGGGKEEDKWKEAYEKELKALDHLHEMELITDIQYYEERSKLNDKYFKDREKYTDDYNKNLEEIYKGFKEAYKKYVDEMSDYWAKSLDAGLISFKQYCTNMKEMLDTLHDSGMLSDEDYYNGLANYYGKIVEYYDKAINAVQRVIKNQIDALNDEKEALEKDYKNRKKLLQQQIDRIQEQIDATEKEIDKLQQANEERQEALNLQKALYELNRAENQRPDYVYNSEKGFIYTNREADIKSAQEEVENLRYEHQISLLEKTVKGYNEQIDLIKENMDKLDEELDGLTEEIDKQIDALQNYSDRWGKVKDKYKEAQEDMAATALWGTNWRNQVLSQEESMVIQFEKTYVEAQENQQKAAVAAAQAIVSAYNDQINALNRWKEAQASAAQTATATSSASTVKANTTTGTKSTSTPTKSVAKQYVGSGSKTGTAYTPSYKNPSSPVNKTKVSSTAQTRSVYVYGTGTDDAKQGIHEVAETGDEIIRDNYGNAFLAKGHQLHRFEGGEKVYSPKETNELLHGKYIPIDSLIPNYSTMLSKVVKSGLTASMNTMNNINTSKPNVQKVADTGKTISITVGDINVTEVDNAVQIAKAIKNQLPNALLQELNKK